MELDAVAQGDTPWLVEVKWKNQPVDYKDLQVLATKAKALAQSLGYTAYTLWFISQSGFKRAALDLAQQEHILVSGGDNLQTLAELLGLRFGR